VLNGSKDDTVQTAFQIIGSVHGRWFSDLQSLAEDELHVTFFYPGAGRTISLAEFLAIFAWHSKHHLGHIKGVKDRMGW
jgi:hypothetical protein